jgi:hypothetical protein
MKYYKINYSENLSIDECEDIRSHFQDDFVFMSPAMEAYDISFKTWNPCRKEIISYCCLGQKTWKYYRKLLNAMIWHVNYLNDSTNLFISSERLFWAKLNELVKDGHMDKRILSLISTNYSGPNRLCWSFKCKHDSMNERVQRHIHRNDYLGELPDSCYLVD